MKRDFPYFFIVFQQKQAVLNPRRVCARRRKEMGSFSPATCASEKMHFGPQTCARRACAAAGRISLKQTPQRSGGCLNFLNRKEDRPRPVGVDPPRRKVLALRAAVLGSRRSEGRLFCGKPNFPAIMILAQLFPSVKKNLKIKYLPLPRCGAASRSPPPRRSGYRRKRAVRRYIPPPRPCRARR